jgi:hypothetical protein
VVDGRGMVLTDRQWAVLELIEACRPCAKVPPSKLRITVKAIARLGNEAVYREAV